MTSFRIPKMRLPVHVTSKRKFHQRVAAVLILLTISGTTIFFTKSNEADQQHYQHSDSELLGKGKMPDKSRDEQDELAAQTSKTFVEKTKTKMNDTAVSLRNTAYPGVEIYTQYFRARSGLVPLTNVQSLKPEFGPVINDVLSFKYPITIPPCASVSGNQGVFIAVISAPNNFRRRDMIRRTWPVHLKSAYYDGLMGAAHLAFFVGLTEGNYAQAQIKEESEVHRDIIQVEMLDTYRNLSLKIAGLFNWVNSNCANVNFVFKVDDDVYVNVHNLAYFVQSYHNSKKSIFGHGWPIAFPDRGGKWKMAYTDWPWNQYPEYVNGPAYLLHGSAVLPLLAACQTTPMMPFEDIYITGLCAERASVKRRFSTGTTRFLASPNMTSNACNVRNHIAWVTDNHLDSHILADDFYRNITQCVTQSNGIKRTRDYAEPVRFHFN